MATFGISGFLIEGQTQMLGILETVSSFSDIENPLVCAHQCDGILEGDAENRSSGSNLWIFRPKTKDCICSQAGKHICVQESLNISNLSVDSLTNSSDIAFFPIHGPGVVSYCQGETYVLCIRTEATKCFS